MPEQRPTGGQLADSSLSTEGYDGSMLSGGSFLSGTDTTSGICFSSRTQGTIPHTPSPPPSPDSVLIIENNCGLSEAFLSNQHPTKASSPGSEMKMAPTDEGWITWAKSPPRPIPALHGPLSLPYARCPSGAEGTIIEEPDNLPRVIWGLDSGEHHSDDFGPDSKTKQEVSAQPPQSFHHTPRQYKPSDDKPAEFSTRTHSSVGSVSSTRAGSDSASLGTLKPRVTSAGYTDVVYSHSPYSETIVLENLVERRNARAVNDDHDYDSTVDLTRALERNLHFRESETELQNSGELDRNLLSRTYGPRNSLSLSRPSGTGLPAMRVSSRPAVGSALPQILIEPRSPEIPQAPSRRMTAMELAHQYQQQQLLKMQQQSLLPTPPNSSSPLWSSEFSPYNHQSVSPVSLRHQVVQEQLRDSETSNQLRHLVRERLGRNIMHDREIPSLAPRIDPVSRLDYPGYEIDPATSQALTNLLATQDYQHLPSLSSEVLLPVPRTAQTLPGYLGHDIRRYAASHRDALLSPSHEEFRYARGHSQHQVPRSIPLARLMQRRLSSVPEEDPSPTINGRSPSPSQLMRHGADRPYLHPPAEHGYQYADIIESSGNYPVAYLDPASHSSQSKVRGPVFSSKSSTAGATALEIQGRYRTRHEGSSSEKDSTTGPKRAGGGLRKTRGRPPRVHPN
ncbi:hypothetical protein BJY52DRAFT_1414793 [Lactarius psammicola]|nr:hypothetical protein BJY52DRAFT_1414793 [Lactarius psammicola]